MPEIDRRTFIRRGLAALSALAGISPFLLKKTEASPLPPPSPSAASFTIDSPSYLLYPKGAQQPFEVRTMPVSSFIDEGRTFLPVREITHALGLTDKEIAWNGETRTITLTHGVLNDRQETEQVTVTMQIGEKTITVNGKEYTIDVSPRIKGDRSFFPARFIVEAFKGKIAFDPDTRTVRIASQTSELPELPIGPDVQMFHEKIKPFLAGGEYMKPEQFNNYFFTHKEATVVLSSSVYETIKKELQKRTIRETEESIKNLIEENPAWKHALESNLNDKNTVFLSADEGYVFTRYEPSPPGDSEWKYKKEFVHAYDATSHYLIKRTDDLEFQGFRHAWHDELGVVSDDGIRTAHRFHKQAPTGEEMERYIMHGTPVERMKTRVRKMFEYYMPGDGVNLFGLDPKEVKHYLETGKSDGFKSFTILPDAEGNPAVILVTGWEDEGERGEGKYGLKYNVESVKEVFEKINKTDRKFVSWAVETGTNIIAMDSAMGHFVRQPTFDGAFHWPIGSIAINEIKNPKKLDFSLIASIIIEEVVAGYFIRSNGSRKNKLYPNDLNYLDDSANLAKGKWVLDWLKQPHVSSSPFLTNDERKYLTDSANFSITRYTPKKSP